MNLSPELMARVRRLSPLEDLSEQACNDLLMRSSTVQELAPGDYVYSQGQQDSFVHYLLRGRVQREVDGTRLDELDADREERTRPLDDSARKRDTVRALSAVTVLRMQRREVEKVQSAGVESSLEVMDIASDTSTDWWTRLLRSDVFVRLSAGTIQSVFDRLEEISVSEGEEVVRQGEAGDYYYVIQSGRAEVMRSAGMDDREVRLAELGPGEGFGEEALIASVPRNATVRMQTPGKLMRLGEADFLDLVVRPLVNRVSQSQGQWLVDEGGCWVDMREGVESGQGLPGALIIPHYLIRGQATRLDREGSYVIAADTPRQGMLAAFLLAARGLDASYLEQPPVILERVAESPPETPDPAPAPVTQEPEADRQPAALEPDVAPAPVTLEPDLHESVELEPHARVVRANGNGAHPQEEQPMTDRSRRSGNDRTDTMIARAGDEELPAPARGNGNGADHPVHDLGDTTTGVELASLLEELERQRAELNGPASKPAIPAPSAPPGSELGVTAEQIVGEILRDVQDNLSGYLAEFMSAQRAALEQRVEQRLAALESSAQSQLAARELEAKARLQNAFAEKERELADAYDRLTTIAERISRQKADIQKARKTLESMLRTASRVHREVYRVGNALASQFDNLDDFGDDFKVH